MIKTRVISAIIDFIITMTFSIVIQQIVLKICLSLNFSALITLFISLATISLTYTLFLTVTALKNGQSIGKKIMKIKILNINGTKADFLTLFQRNLSGLIVNTAFGIGFIINIFIMSKSQYEFSIQDSYAQTKVVRVENEK